MTFSYRIEKAKREYGTDGNNGTDGKFKRKVLFRLFRQVVFDDKRLRLSGRSFHTNAAAG